MHETIFDGQKFKQFNEEIVNLEFSTAFLSWM